MLPQDVLRPDISETKGPHIGVSLRPGTESLGLHKFPQLIPGIPASRYFLSGFLAWSNRPARYAENADALFVGQAYRRVGGGKNMTESDHVQPRFFLQFPDSRFRGAFSGIDQAGRKTVDLPIQLQTEFPDQKEVFFFFIRYDNNYGIRPGMLQLLLGGYGPVKTSRKLFLRPPAVCSEDCIRSGISTG